MKTFNIQSSNSQAADGGSMSSSADTWIAGAYCKFSSKPTEKEIDEAKKIIAAELMDAIEACDFIIKPFGDTGSWTVAVKIYLPSKEPTRPLRTQEINCMEPSQCLHADMCGEFVPKKV